ncbi:hypothetical protein [Thermococcus sp.]|uniref:hypothetical protein n=1 Tax=Thermococcus sp. TaxID=35749 RepID=UPI0026060878|nr:hypothetical protein [Thermococcus sp.]
MRRGQLLSFDALISLVIVIFILSAVSSSADSFTSGISSMVGWYERINLADNMINVLVNSPGEPENWNSTDVIVFGLSGKNGYVDYSKLSKLISLLESNNTHAVSVLERMASGMNFQISFGATRSQLFVNFTTALKQGYSWNGTVYNGDCSITGSKDIVFSDPTIVNCTSGFRRTGSGDLTADSSLCIVSGFDYTGSGDVTVGSYLAINGTFDESGSGDISVGGDLYSLGYWDRTGSGTINITGNAYVNYYVDFKGSDFAYVGGSLYIFNAQLPSVGLTGSNDVLINGWIYIEYNGVWYATKGYVSSAIEVLTWYKWNGDRWVQSEGLPNAIYRSGSGSLEILGSTPLTPPPSSYPVPPCLGETGTTTVQLSSLNLTISFNYPQILSSITSYEKSFAVINGTLTTDANLIQQSKSSASWVEYSARISPLSKEVYSREYTFSSLNTPEELYSGILDQYTADMLNITLPSDVDSGNLTLISAFTTSEYTGYAVFVLVKNGTEWVYGINMTRVYPTYRTSGVPDNCEVKLNDGQVTLPLSCLIPRPSLDNPVTFTVWAYSLGGFPQVTIEDIGNLDVYLKPIKQMGVIKLWLWPRR